MPNDQEPQLKYFWVTMRFEGQFRLLVPAISEVEAIILSDEMDIPSKEISVEWKDVVGIEQMRPV